MLKAEVVIKPKAIADIEKAVKEKQQQIDNRSFKYNEKKKLLHKH